ASGHHFHAFHLTVADYGHRLAVEEELNPFFAGVGDFPARAGHILFIAAVCASHACCTLANRGAVTVHRCVTTTENHDSFAAHIDELGRIFFKPELPVHIGDEEWQSVVYAGQVFAREAALHVVVGAHAQEHCVEFFEQLIHGNVFAHFRVQTEFHAHFFEHLAAANHDAFFQFEFRNTEGEQAADFRIAVKYHRLDAVAH